MTVLTISALQIQNHSLSVASALEQILDSESELSSQQPFLVVAPEASIGGYPKGTGFGTFVGYRLEAGREEFRKYFNEAIVVPGPETNELAGFSKRIGCFLTIGVIERADSSLYCTVLTFSPVEGLVNSRRKLMPTAAERLVWGQGDGAKLSPVKSSYGRLNSAVCWENYMPLMRAALYAKGVEFWCAPTMDDRDVWRSSMRHIATEGRCFLISACQFQPSPSSLGIKVPSWDEDKPLVNGGSMIVGPLGDIITGPLLGSSGIVTAQIETDDITRARYDFDPSGHYSRPDIFELRVNESTRPGVEFYECAEWSEP